VRAVRPAYGSRSLAACGMMLVETQAYHPLMVVLLQRGQTAAWMLALLSGLLAALSIWPVAAVLRRFPGRTIIEIADMTLGRGAAVAAGLLLAGSLSFIGGMILRETSEMAITAAYPHTPQTVATVTILLGAVYVAWGNGAHLVRLTRILLPMLLGSVLLVVVFNVAWGRMSHLLPLWGPGIPTLLAGVPSLASFYAPLALLSLLADGVSDRQKAVWWLPGAALASGLVTCLQALVLSIIYPYPLGNSFTFPFHVAARLVLGGRFFERVEAVWLFMWVGSTVVLSGALLYGSSLAVAQAFRMPRHTMAVPALAVVVLTVAFFSRNQSETVAWHAQAAPLLFAVTLALPALLALIAALRGPRRRSHEA
jgi:spore germination protein KB